MVFKLVFTEEAIDDIDKLKANKSLQKRFKAVSKAIRYLQANPRHPSLNTHKYDALTGNGGEEIFEAYAENNTPAAYRIFWYYGPDKNFITIVAIKAHP